MTQAFNLSQLANNVNSSGQINASTGLYNAVPAAATLTTTNFTILESGGNLLIKYGATTIITITSSGNIITTGNMSGVNLAASGNILATGTIGATGAITSANNVTAYGTL
jgi:hypothetical protein